jgi:predicted nuclease of predicted toxin-antitoxin system
MKLLANENFPLASVHILERAGYDIKFIGIECPSVSDEEVLQLAISEERMVITFDRDYGELVFRYGYRPESGVIYLRFQFFTPEYPGNYLQELFQHSDLKFENTFTVIDNISLRQRKY